MAKSVAAVVVVMTENVVINVGIEGSVTGKVDAPPDLSEYTEVV